MARASSPVAAVLLAVLLAVVPTARHAMGEPDAPDLGALAQAILRGADDAAAQAALRAKSLSPEATQRLVAEIASQVRAYRALDGAQVTGLTWENVGLDVVLAQLRTVTGRAVGATPRVAAEREEMRINLHIDASSVSTLLDLITEPFDLAWGVRDGGVRIFAKQEVSVADAVPLPTVAVRIDKVRVTLEKEGTLAEVVAALRSATGVDVTIDPRVAPELSTRRFTVHWVGVSLREALDSLVTTLGPGVAWTVRGDAVVLTASSLVPR